MDDADGDEARRYGEKHHLATYFEDAVEMLLKTKEIHPNVNVSKHFEKYFQQVSRGTHVLHRDFRFICATFHNRLCFASLVRKSFQGLFANVERLSLAEYHVLLELLCPDFPAEFLEKIQRLLPSFNSLGVGSLITPLVFFNAFQMLFAFPEFTEIAKEVYDDSQRSSGVTSHSVDSGAFYKKLNERVQNAPYSIPPQTAMLEILTKPRLNFVEFVEIFSCDESLQVQLGSLRLSLSDEGIRTNPSCDPLCVEATTGISP